MQLRPLILLSILLSALAMPVAADPVDRAAKRLSIPDGNTAEDKLDGDADNINDAADIREERKQEIEEDMEEIDDLRDQREAESSK